MKMEKRRWRDERGEVADGCARPRRHSSVPCLGKYPASIQRVIIHLQHRSSHPKEGGSTLPSGRVTTQYIHTDSTQCLSLLHFTHPGLNQHPLPCCGRAHTP